MRNASGHQGANQRHWKKVNRNACNISSIKRVTMRFLEVSRSSRAKQRERNMVMGSLPEIYKNRKSLLHV